MTALIAGGGISGLALALRCHQVAIPFQVYEASPKRHAQGVGINLQPFAVRRPPQPLRKGDYSLAAHRDKFLPDLSGQHKKERNRSTP
jgi:hypothetical protein